jgi:inhibitor of cysteine peptidase
MADNFTDPAKPIMVGKTSSTFTIKLKSNPTTGFSWFLVGYDSNVIKPVSHKYYAPNTKLVGASGYEKWIFKVKPAGFVVPQITKIQLAYTRPWNLENYRPTTFKVVIHD